MTTTEEKGWNPYFAGALSGLLLILSVWVSGNYFNVTNAIVRTAGLLEKLFGPERAARMAYFIKYVPKIDWEWMFVVGIVIGSFVSAITAGSFQFKAVPDMWERRFGPSWLKRDSVAFIGGMLVMFGARLAGG